MQYRIFLAVMIYASCSMSVGYAQKHNAVATTTMYREVAPDTIVIINGIKQPSKPKLLAYNTTVPNNKSVNNKAIPGNSTQNIHPRSGYKHVPLAGEKAYFGDMNDYVNNFVRQYLEVHNQTLNTVQSRSNTPFSLIDNVLEKNNIPKQLKYLAVIESALNHNAVSRVGAVGPWQLMSTTARMMGLSVTRHQDDRTDWYKSTTAAAKYLSILYGQMDDWLLVIAAYNCGPTPVQRAIERTGSHNFWDIKPYLPHETQGHVLAFIATASIFENLSKFIGLGSIPLDFNFSGGPGNIASNSPVANKQVFTDEELKSMTIVRLDKPLSMDLMCQQLEVDKKLLTRWNPDYDLYMYNTYPSDYYNLRIPKDKLTSFVQKKQYMLKKSKELFSDKTM